MTTERRLLLLGRDACGLCEEMAIELGAHPLFPHCVIEHRDVDSDPILQRRYGLRIPVLLDHWNDAVCEGRFDAQAFERWWADQRP